MNTFPLIRTKSSNEKIMAGVFLILVLYQLPVWVKKPTEILNFILIITVGLLLDAVLNFLRYKQMWCSVSASISAAILCLFTYGVPLWGRLLGIVVALVLGKHVWGGTGKNVFNPAMVGLLFLIPIFPITYPFFEGSFILLPALILGIPFLKIRPLAGIGFMVGLIISFFLNGAFSLENIVVYGMFFWACIVITDPVTITDHPVIGSITGLFVGLSTLINQTSVIVIMIGVLAFNLISYVTEKLTTKSFSLIKHKLRISKVAPYSIETADFIDLTGKEDLVRKEINDISKDEILECVKVNEVFGMGGAAYSTYQKLNALQKSEQGKKYLIINGVECDPGLIHDYWLLRNRSKEIIKGIELLNKMFGFTSIHLAVKDAKGINYPEYIKLNEITDFYPAGAERILISEVMNKEIASDEIPAKCGILVLNVQTVYSIYEAVLMNKKADTRFLTVANLKETSAKVVRVRLGTKIQEVLEKIYPGSNHVFAGGGIMQSYCTDENSVVESSVNYIATAVFPRYKESPQCSKCGICYKNCPAGIKVNVIADLVECGKVSATQKYKVKKCIGCGSCSYSCLAGRNLSEKIKIAKEAIS